MITVDPETKEEAIRLALDVLIPFDPDWAARDAEAAGAVEENRDLRFALHKIRQLVQDPERTSDERLAAIRERLDIALGDPKTKATQEGAG